MAYYTDQDVNEFLKQIKTNKSKEQYMKDAAMDLGRHLIKKPIDYKSFGPYWWTVKEMLTKYFNGKAWFKGKDNNPVVKNRNWHGTLFKTIIAGLSYHSDTVEYKSEHTYNHNGIQKPYTLIDHDAGM